MRLVITRGRSEDTGTKGRMVLETGWSADTLELPWRNNEKGRSCIVADTYRAWKWFSPHFNRYVYRLEDRYERADCLIHPATFAGDASLGLETQLHGCTAPGHGYAMLDRLDGIAGKQRGIIHSGVALEELLSQSKGVDLEVTYQWDTASAPADLSHRE